MTHDGRLRGVGWSWRSALFGIALALCIAPPARADVDPGGAWQIAVTDPFFGTVSFDVNFQRSGTALTASRFPAGPFPFRGPIELTGSLDPVSGAFSVSGLTCPAGLGSNSGSITGTFDASGDTFTGTMAAGVVGGLPIKCLGVAGSATGTRTSATCGNGVADSGEECDAGLPGDGCCTATCTAIAAGTLCTLTDFVCELGTFGCPFCSRGACDGSGGCTQTPRPAGNVCRQAANECDVTETCDGTSLDCPPDQAVPPPDTDGDGLNDGCDPCTGGVGATKARLSASRLLPTTSPDRLSLRGRLLLSDLTGLDPVQHGLRLVVDDAAGRRQADIAAPPGAAWSTKTTGWTYRSADGGTSVKLKRDGSTPGLLSAAVRARSTFPGALAAGDLPVKATVVLDPPHATTGLCGEATFPGPAGEAPACALKREGRTLSCR